MKKLLTFFSITLLTNFAIVFSVNAAELYVATSKKPVTPGGIIEIDVRLHSNYEEVNALESVLYYPDQLDLIRTNLDSSFISLWIKGPVAEKSSVPGFKAIAMSGLVPGGVAVAGNTISSFTFSVSKTTPEETSLLFSLKNARVLRNDGKGSAVDLTVKNATVQVVKSNGSTTSTVNIELPKKGTTPPEPFSIAVAQNSSLFSGKWFAAFNAFDQDSGIDRYQIQETSESKPDETKWVNTQNPTELSDQTLKSYIFVRAYDRAGNFRDAMYSKSGITNKNSYSNIVIGCILVTVVLVLLVRLFVLTKNRRRNHE